MTKTTKTMMKMTAMIRFSSITVLFTDVLSQQQSNERRDKCRLWSLF